MSLTIPRSLLGDDADFFAPFFRTPALGSDMGSALTASTGQLAARSIAVDVSEKDNSFEIHADIPGVSKDDIKVNVDHDVLRISVEKAEEKAEDKEEEGRRWHRMERSSYYSGRALRMPSRADLDNVKASYQDGVLRLEVPKKTEEQMGIKQVAIA